MRENIEQRACELAVYIIETHATVRAAARHFGVSKSTVHKDLSERLPHWNRALYLQVKAVMEQNKAERHIPRRLGHAPEISRGVRRFLAKRAYLWYDDTKRISRSAAAEKERPGEDLYKGALCAENDGRSGRSTRTANIFRSRILPSGRRSPRNIWSRSCRS